MRTLVTGAAGFIGSHVVDRLLEEGDEVVGVDDLSSGTRANLADALQHPSFSFHEADITSPRAAELVEEAAPEVILHLAAQVDVRKSVAQPIHDALVNIIGTVNLLDAADRAGVRKVVFTSSGGCIYGEPEPSRLPVTEDQVFWPESMPESPYGVSKKVVLDYLRYFKAGKGLDYTALALSNVYGPRQEPASEVGLEGQVVAIFSRKMLAGDRCTIYGDGEQTRDFVYVGDVVSAYVAAREAAGGELVNVGSGEELSVNELYQRLASLTGTDTGPEYAPARPGELRRIVIDPGKAGRVLDWKPAVALDEGLARTVDWFKKHEK